MSNTNGQAQVQFLQCQERVVQGKKPKPPIFPVTEVSLGVRPRPLSTL